MKIAQGFALAVMAIIYYPLVAPVATLFALVMGFFDNNLDVDKISQIWSFPFTMVREQDR